MAYKIIDPNKYVKTADGYASKEVSKVSFTDFDKSLSALKDQKKSIEEMITGYQDKSRKIQATIDSLEALKTDKPT